MAINPTVLKLRSQVAELESELAAANDNADREREAHGTRLASYSETLDKARADTHREAQNADKQRRAAATAMQELHAVKSQLVEEREGKQLWFAATIALALLTTLACIMALAPTIVAG